MTRISKIKLPEKIAALLNEDNGKDYLSNYITRDEVLTLSATDSRALAGTLDEEDKKKRKEILNKLEERREDA